MKSVTVTNFLWVVMCYNIKVITYHCDYDFYGSLQFKKDLSKWGFHGDMYEIL